MKRETHHYEKASLALHAKHRGKLEVRSKVPLESRDDLSTAYTPGVAAPCEAIAKDPELAYTHTMKANTVAVVSDGSAVLGLGNIGGLAGLPVMEGKCVLFKKFANIDAFPICLDTQEPDEIVKTIKHIAPNFGGINLEDIAAPNCFYIEEALKEAIDIPVFHDDQHGTAIVILAGLINALKVVGKHLSEVRIVIAGAGAAGIATARLLLAEGAHHIVITDRKGLIFEGRDDLNLYKERIAKLTNRERRAGNLADAMVGADVFIGVSHAHIADRRAVSRMAKDPIVFAMANPTPEIMPEEAALGGAKIIATGRSDYPNQINNVLAFPGVFRGILNVRARYVTDTMKIAAAHALAKLIKHPTPKNIIPDVFDGRVAPTVARAVSGAAAPPQAQRTQRAAAPVKQKGGRARPRLPR